MNGRQEGSGQGGEERRGWLQRLREQARRHPLLTGGILGAVLLVAVAVPTYLVVRDDRPEVLVGCLDESQIEELEERAVRYEGEELPYSQSSVERALEVTNGITRLGHGAGLVLTKPDDPPYRGEIGFRAEWQSDFYSTDGNEYSYGVSYWFPEDWNQGENPDTFDDRLIFQFHEGAGTSPTFSLHIDAEEERLVLRHRRGDGDMDYLWSAPLETERWYDIAFQAKWSTDDDGYFRLYVDGELQQEFRGETLTETDRVYTKWGIYGQPTKLIVDEVVIIEGAYGLPLATPSEIHTVLDASGDEASDRAQRRCQV